MPTDQEINNTDQPVELITVQLLGSGWAAVHMALNTTDVPGVKFYEPWQTGIGRYANIAGAQREACAWSESDEIPLDKGLTCADSHITE